VQTPPQGEHWTKIRSPSDAKPWKPVTALPPRLQAVDVYGVSDDENFMVFVARDRVLGYDAAAHRAFYIDVPSLESEGINRVAFERGQFVLYRSGVAGSRFTPASWKVTEFEEAETKH
jgi:hypothetical protein